MKKWLIPAFAVLLLVSLVFDKEIAYSIVNYRSEFITPIMFGFSFIGSSIAVFLLTTILFSYDKKKRDYIPLLWLTLFVAFVLGFLLKYIIARPRPEISPLQVNNNFSFPSGHAIAVFSVLALIDKEFPKLKFVWLSIAVIVLFSRVYLGVHYMSDVIAGGLIGYITGLFVLTITKNI